jgi:glycosyltransferase involved in cell wall biosynthesis
VVLFNAGGAPVRKGLDLAEAAMGQAESVAGTIRFEVMRGGIPPERVPLLMNAADCLLVTSRSEGSPVVVKEALACNLPIVSVDVGDVAERLRGVWPSFIVERDPKQIARALIEVLSAKKRSNGRERVAELSETRIAERIRSIYSSIRPQFTNRGPFSAHECANDK